MGDGAKAVRDDKAGSSVHERLKAVLMSRSDSVSRLLVASSRIRMRGIGKDRTGDRESLPLSTRQFYSAFADERVVSFL